MAAPPAGRVRLEREGGAARIVASGRLEAATLGPLWDPALREAAAAPEGAALDLAAVEAIDSAGAALLLEMERLRPGLRAERASPTVAAVLDRTRQALAAAPPAKPPTPLPPVQAVGQWAVEAARGALAGVGFLGEAAVVLLRGAARPRLLRLGDLLRHLDEVGLRAFPLTLLLGVLIGVILAFQSSIPMRRFGAEIFIPNLVGISLLRELGPLMAAVILAGRTGSAFAAELGTMTVNEEVDALKIMGVDPVAFLVLPRLVAATVVMPVLALLMNLAGLTGMTIVMGTLGFPVAAVTSQLTASLSVGDLLGGLFKAAVFGLVIAGIGCRAGLGAGRGPRAVGDAATSAVVGGIVAIVLLDGLFAVLFFRMGI